MCATSCLGGGGVVDVRVVPVGAAHVVLGDLDLVEVLLAGVQSHEDVIRVTLWRDMEAVDVEVRGVELTDGVGVEEESQFVLRGAGFGARTRGQTVLQPDLQQLTRLRHDSLSGDFAIVCPSHVGSADEGCWELSFLQGQLVLACTVLSEHFWERQLNRLHSPEGGQACVELLLGGFPTLCPAARKHADCTLAFRVFIFHLLVMLLNMRFLRAAHLEHRAFVPEALGALALLARGCCCCNIFGGCDGGPRKGQ
mmetsp:Transcript_52177/g.111066  ORF Transcript_52177/g.111066 Transcript_52177/m.111066 type:complete len:253 (+) Transcript_52177:1547-2305(+)